MTARKVRTYVLFNSSFRYDAAPNISHETVNGLFTPCLSGSHPRSDR